MPHLFPESRLWCDQVKEDTVLVPAFQHPLDHGSVGHVVLLKSLTYIGNTLNGLIPDLVPAIRNLYKGPAVDEPVSCRINEVSRSSWGVLALTFVRLRIFVSRHRPLYQTARQLRYLWNTTWRPGNQAGGIPDLP